MKALVLAAGYGTRLGDLTRDTPKPMLPIGGEPLLAHTLRYLARHGFTEVAVNLHFCPELVREHFGDGSRWGVRLTYSFEPELLGTAGAVKQLETFFAGESAFLVLYGDLLIDQDLAPLLELHRRRDASATLLLHQRPGSNSLVALDADGRIRDFIERPDEATRAAHPHPWVNSGCQLLNSRLLPLIPAGRPSDLPRDLYAPRAAGERFYGLPLTGYRCAIDSPARYAAAEAAFREGRYRAC